MSITTSEAEIKEIWALFKETDERFKQTDSELSKRFKETDEKFKETNEKFKKTDKHLNRLERLFSGQWGKLIEALAESGIVELLQERGIKVIKLSRRIEAKKNGRQMELDFLITNTDELVVGEVKTTLKTDDVKDFLKKLQDFFIFFPEYKQYKIYGAVIGVQIDQGVDRFAYQRGLYVFKVGGEGTLSMLNDEKFRPVDFSQAKN